MKLPPNHILYASLRLLHLCSYTTRNWTLDKDISREQINALWEAIHVVPSLLTRWHPDAEEELLMYYDEYDSQWSSPQLRALYEQCRDELFGSDAELFG